MWDTLLTFKIGTRYDPFFQTPCLLSNSLSHIHWATILYFIVTFPCPLLPLVLILNNLFFSSFLLLSIRIWSIFIILLIPFVFLLSSFFSAVSIVNPMHIASVNLTILKVLPFSHLFSRWRWNFVRKYQKLNLTKPYWIGTRKTSCRRSNLNIS